MSSATSESSPSTPVNSGKKHILYPSTSQQQSSSSASPPTKSSMATGSGQAKSSPARKLSGSQSYIQQQQQTLMNQPQQPNPHQYYSLRWNNYQTWVLSFKPASVVQNRTLTFSRSFRNLTDMFHELLNTEKFVDVTLACERNLLKCHKVSLNTKRRFVSL